MAPTDAQILRFPTERTSPEPNLREAIGDVLREERHDQERTLADVAEEAGVSLPYLSEIERGRKDASAEVLTSITRALGIEVPVLLERTAERLRGTSGTLGTVLSLLRDSARLGVRAWP